MAAGQASALAEFLRTLGDATRLRILTALDGVCVPVTAIVEATGERQPTVSHHLRILRSVEREVFSRKVDPLTLVGAHGRCCEPGLVRSRGRA